MLNPLMNGPAGEYRNLPVGSTNSWSVIEKVKKGDPGIAVRVPLFALTVNPNMSPKSSDTYKNLPEGSATMLEMNAILFWRNTKGNPGSSARDPVGRASLDTSTLFDYWVPGHRDCPDGCASMLNGDPSSSVEEVALV